MEVKIMDFLENALDKAREVIDVACKKTNEVVITEKQKFDIASIENKRAKDFERLGKLYFKLYKDSDIENGEMKLQVQTNYVKKPYSISGKIAE